MVSSSDILNAKCLIVDDKEVNVVLLEQNDIDFLIVDDQAFGIQDIG